MPYWLRTAQDITRDPVTAEDLLQDAVSSLLAAWQRGDGPDSNPRAYVTSTMRNQHASYARSPRARVDTGADDLLGSVAESRLENEDIDLASEAARVRRALLTLSPEHHRVLVATTAEGMKPRDLVDELARPAPAISALLLRAKRALKRALLIEHLSEGTPTCTQNAHQLPASVHSALSEQRTTDPGMPHVRDCEVCQKNWLRFAAAATAFGTLPLLTVTLLGGDATPAQAAGPTSDTPSPDASTARGLPRETTEAWRKLFASKTFLSIGLGASTVLLAGAGIYIALGQPETTNTVGEIGHRKDVESSLLITNSTEKAGPTGLDAELEVTTAGRLTGVRMHIQAEPSAPAPLESLRFELPPGTTVDGDAANLACSKSSPTSIVCTPKGNVDLSREVNVHLNNAPLSGELKATLHLTLEGRSYTGKIQGAW